MEQPLVVKKSQTKGEGVSQFDALGEGQCPASSDLPAECLGYIGVGLNGSGDRDVVARIEIRQRMITATVCGVRVGRHGRRVEGEIRGSDPGDRAAQAQGDRIRTRR